MGSSLRVVEKCSRKTYSKTGRDDCGYGDSGGVKTIVSHLPAGR
jgi:hypothetical protein